MLDEKCITCRVPRAQSRGAVGCSWQRARRVSTWYADIFGIQRAVVPRLLPNHRLCLPFLSLVGVGYFCYVV